MTQETEETNMEESPEPSEGAPSIDRRALIRKGALVGGSLVWAVPLIKSMHVTAAEGSPPPPPLG
jgi:hypothetical protein